MTHESILLFNTTGLYTLPELCTDAHQLYRVQNNIYFLIISYIRINNSHRIQHKKITHTSIIKYASIMEHPWETDDTVTSGSWVDALAIRPTNIILILSFMELTIKRNKKMVPWF